MGHKGVSKRKPKAQKQKVQSAATTGTAGVIEALSRESDARIPRTIGKGQAITSGKGGKEKYSETTTNKKK